MQNAQQRLFRIAALFVALGIALSAFGAHALKDKLSEYSIGVYEKAGFYQITQSIGLLIIAALASHPLVNATVALRAAKILSVGIAIFCTSLYLLAVTDQHWLGAITPLGGLAMIAAWSYLALAGLKPGGAAAGPPEI